ncbi:MAG TPA: hypothetical protein VMC07_00660 [Candidatus Omnitrophota bacterium]|nr:hypothetical protein [Candidatus Omnitrophota bacterium]
MELYQNNDLAVLVVDGSETNKYRGKIGRLKHIDRFQITAQFADGGEASFDYGEGHMPFMLFYRHYDKWGIMLDESGRGPQNLFRSCREMHRITFSEIIDEYIKIFGERPERLG